MPTGDPWCSVHGWSPCSCTVVGPLRDIPPFPSFPLFVEGDAEHWKKKYDELLFRVQQMDNTICWNVTCAHQAVDLDKSYAEYFQRMRPIEMILDCPACGQGHIDEDSSAHTTHTCVAGDYGPGCGYQWAPSSLPTYGSRAGWCYAPDDKSCVYDDEIQVIYEAIRQELGKPPSKRGIWTSNGVTIGICLPLGDTGEVTPEGVQAVLQAGQRLGVSLTPTDTWEDAGSRLRAYQGASIGH